MVKMVHLGDLGNLGNKDLGTATMMMHCDLMSIFDGAMAARHDRC